MISSRCKDLVLFDNKMQPMSILRTAMKEKLENMKLGGFKMFKVWIHEDESDTAGNRNTWEQCMEQARNADVFIALYNGRAGWTGSTSPVREGLGICHSELEVAFNKAPGKIRTIQFNPLVPAEPNTPDKRFQDYFSLLNLPGAQVADGDDALRRVDSLAAAIVLSLAREGVGLQSSGSYYAGEALAWSRMNFERRRDSMTDAVEEFLRSRSPRKSGADVLPSPRSVVVRIRELPIGFVCDAIPGPMGTAAARELVGQPFLRDHLTIKGWNDKIAGPVHVIACQKSITENQALRQLGFPDAVVVSAPFGVYVADETQSIQMAFLANCRDETTTEKGVQTFMQWLLDYGEAQHLARRAKNRRKLCDLMRDLSTRTADLR